MNKKGFTLIELLAVIIILSLLAFLASTSVTKVVKDSKSDLYSTQISLIKTAAEAWGADNLDKLPELGECKYISLSNLKGYGLLDSSIINPKTNEEFSDDLKIKITSQTTGYGNADLTYEVAPTSITGCTEVYPAVCTYVDSEDDKGTAIGIIDLSDVVTCGTESFYVMSNNGKVVTALAAKNINLDLENPIQSDSAGTISFAKSLYWYDGTNYTIDTDFVYGDYENENAEQQNNLYPYVEAYESYLKNNLNVTSADATIMNYTQLNKLYTNYLIDVNNDMAWYDTPQYWTGTVDTQPEFVWYGGDGNGSIDYSKQSGIRPVVTISTFEIKLQEN